MHSDVKVSVVIPVYNTQRYLRQCMESVLAQTLREIEIICVDDGSTDGSVDVIKKYMAQDGRISLIQQGNRYAGAARNNGMEHAKGKYIVFLDSDDFFERDMLESMYEAAKSSGAQIVVCGAREYDASEGKTIDRPEYLKTELLPKTAVGGTFSSEDIKDLIFQFTCDAPWNKMYLLEFVKSYELYFQEVKRANDTRFVNASLAAAKKIAVIDKPLVNYRINHGGNLQSTYDDRPFTFYDTLKGLNEELKRIGVYETVRKSYVNKALGLALNGLGRMKSYKSYATVYNRLKSGAFEELEIDGHEKSYYYNAYDYRNMKRIMRLPAWVMYAVRGIAA